MSSVDRKRLPSLPDTGRLYVEQTRRARLASPGVERYRRRGGRTGRLVVALAAVAGLVALMLLLA
jgi:hypothetical protein